MNVDKTSQQLSTLGATRLDLGGGLVLSEQKKNAPMWRVSSLWAGYSVPMDGVDHCSLGSFVGLGTCLIQDISSPTMTSSLKG